MPNSVQDVEADPRVSAFRDDSLADGDWTPTTVREALDPLRHSRQFAEADDRIAAWQVGSTLLVAAAVLLASWWALPWAVGSLLLGPVLVRLFVLQHDCGHGSLCSTRTRNDRLGTALSWISGVPFEPWRTEHHWHHYNQGRLSRRGVDRVNSPMTVREARQDPAGARLRRGLISVPGVLVLGGWSILAKRKRLQGFFPFRAGFPGPRPDRAAQRRGLFLTLVPHVSLHVALAASLGWRAWALYAGGLALGAAAGAMLFWVQHNFEHTVHADDDTWDFVRVAVNGSSYLRFGSLGTWVTASIGLHHVHHLNPRIPNHRLEAARRSIPELARVQPLGLADLRRCFTHVFWDEARDRMVADPD